MDEEEITHHLNLNYPSAESFIDCHTPQYQTAMAQYTDPVLKDIFGDHSIRINLVSMKPILGYLNFINKNTTFKMRVLIPNKGQFTFDFR